MTTIAYRDGILAADTQLTFGNIAGYGHKIVRIPELNCYFAAAGDTDTIAEALSYLRGTVKKKPTAKSLKGFEAILVSDDGKAALLTDNLNTDIIAPNTFIAVGSGWQLAMLGMKMGFDAPTAVMAAGELDVHTNTLVDVYDSRERQLLEVTFPV